MFFTVIQNTAMGVCECLLYVIFCHLQHQIMYLFYFSNLENISFNPRFSLIRSALIKYPFVVALKKSLILYNEASFVSISSLS